MGCLATILLCGARTRGWGLCGCNGRLGHRQPGFVRLEARNTNVVIPLEVKLKIPHFQRVATAVFGKAACKVCDRVDELVRDVEQQLGRNDVSGSVHELVIALKHKLTSSTSGSIFTLGSMLETKSWMDLRIL